MSDDWQAVDPGTTAVMLEESEQVDPAELARRQAEWEASPDGRRAARKLRRKLARPLARRLFDYAPIGGSVPCPVCRAEPDRFCVARSGRTRPSVHRARRDLARATIPDCQTCGACCLAWPWGSGRRKTDPLFDPQRDVDLSDRPFVDVHEGESVPAAFLDDRQGPSPFSSRSLRVADGRCLALVGEVPGARCGIYQDRPEVCRAFRPGTFRCGGIGSGVGLPGFPDGKVR